VNRIDCDTLEIKHCPQCCDAPATYAWHADGECQNCKLGDIKSD
jgi:hypothetical protein